MNKSTKRAQAAIAVELTRLRHENSQLRNAHDDLVAALEACLIRLDEHDPQSVPEALQARAALAKAKGNQ